MRAAETRAELFTALCRARRCEEVITGLESLLEWNRAHAEIHYQLAYCRSGECRPHTMIDEDSAFEHYRQALRHSDSSERSPLQARILGALGTAYLRNSMVPPGKAFVRAIQCHVRAAGILLRRGDWDGWAREHYNLGNAWCEASPAIHPNKWREAIDHFEMALEVRTREVSADRHAAILQNLGTAYRELPALDRRKNLRKAIRCYHDALRTLASGGHAMRRAALQNNLGNAFLTLSHVHREHQAKHVRSALRHLALSLRVWTRAEHPCEHAVACFNRGNALVLLATSPVGSPAILREAAVCFEDAMECFRACGRPSEAESAHQWLERIQGWLASA